MEWWEAAVIVLVVLVGRAVADWLGSLSGRTGR